MNEVFQIFKEMIRDFKFFGHDLEEPANKYRVRALRPVILCTCLVMYLSVVNDDLKYRDALADKWYSIQLRQLTTFYATNQE